MMENIGCVLLNAAKNEDLDFIIQLGDFCQPKEANKEFLIYLIITLAKNIM